MAKQYILQFGTGSPTLRTGLSPSFVVFRTVPGGVSALPPGVTEIPTSTGLYYFTYGPTNAVSFVIDGGSSIADNSQRYISGALDPVQAVDEGITTLVAAVGTTGDSFGSTSIDPLTLYGYLKRALEFNEGNSTFNKSSGAWNIYSRGSSTLLRVKALTDSSGIVTKA